MSRTFPRQVQAPAADPTDVLSDLLPSVRRWMHRLLGAHGGMDDAVQDAMIEIARALPRFRGGSSLDTYAHRISIRVAARYWRKRRLNEVSLELVPPLEDCIDPESLAAQRESLRRLYRCLQKLSSKRRIAFVLCDIEGYTPTEAAAVVGVRAATMRSRLRHARRELGRLLQGDPYLSRLGRERR